MMDRQVAQMVRLIDDLLDVARITRGKLELRRSPRRPGRRDPAVAVESCRPLIDGAKHELTVELPAEPLTLDGDPVRLAQVFGNLLNNAVQVHRAGRPHRRAARARGRRGRGLGAGRRDRDPRRTCCRASSTSSRRSTRASSARAGGLGHRSRAREAPGRDARRERRRRVSDGPGRGSEFTCACRPGRGERRASTGRRAAGRERSARGRADPDRRRQPRQRRVAGARCCGCAGHEVASPSTARRRSSGRGVPARRGVARHRHAAAERLRGLPPHPRAGLGAGRADRRGDRLGPGRRSPALARGGLRRAPRQARELRRLEDLLHRTQE